MTNPMRVASVLRSSSNPIIGTRMKELTQVCLSFHFQASFLISFHQHRRKTLPLSPLSEVLQPEEQSVNPRSHSHGRKALRMYNLPTSLQSIEQSEQTLEDSHRNGENALISFTCAGSVNLTKKKSKSYVFERQMEYLLVLF